jgi:hypothetical protein
VRKKVLNWTKSILLQYGQYLVLNQIVQSQDQVFSMDIEPIKMENIYNQTIQDQNINPFVNQYSNQEAIKSKNQINMLQNQV